METNEFISSKHGSDDDNISWTEGEAADILRDQKDLDDEEYEWDE